MNWYKIAQEYAPIGIVSYFSGDLEISFNGGKKYTYENVPPVLYDRLDGLLRKGNYSAAQKILQNLSSKNDETEEDKQEMLNELYERASGYVHLSNVHILHMMSIEPIDDDTAKWLFYVGADERFVSNEDYLEVTESMVKVTYFLLESIQGLVL